MAQNIKITKESNDYIRIAAEPGYELVCKQTDKKVSEAVIKESDIDLFIAVPV